MPQKMNMRRAGNVYFSKLKKALPKSLDFGVKEKWLLEHALQLAKDLTVFIASAR